MTAWELLSNKSTAPANSTAWTHINSISDSGAQSYVPVDAINLTLKESNLQASIKEDNYILSFDENEISIFTDNELIVEINTGDIKGYYNATKI